eukprot:CAMPEP_0168523540 /NCGR_PEP_ID=MMETSP0405-20121227/10044_1 /TAXON_ID=498012 /ORGANISM="Trichosphaerium sp, Strain Am-I-7 wt" /LENGTH=220 /DNA_ID=CAMNT_0008545433 /DNA_START=158 /DNA_END=821 /DNA_ORIENTATION=+
MTTFKDVTSRLYRDQATFFLNAFWPELGDKKDELENTWKYVNMFIELDIEKGDEGSDLDEFNAHRFLEKIGTTKRVVELRDSLREIDMDFNKRMALVEYLLFRHKFKISVMLERPQGTNEMLARAQQALKAVQTEIAKIEQKKKELQAKSAKGGVRGNAAKNELEQLLSSDNTALNRAVLTAEAAVRKAAKMEGTAAQGSIWFMQRELEEAKKYKPRSKQ